MTSEEKFRYDLRYLFALRDDCNRSHWEDQKDIDLFDKYYNEFINLYCPKNMLSSEWGGEKIRCFNASGEIVYVVDDLNRREREKTEKGKNDT